MRASSLVVLLVGACGRIGFDAPRPADDPDGGARDGARLRIVWNTLEDGTRIPAGLFDAERGEPCDVRVWADGARYCTPTDRARPRFADAGCTDPLLSLATCQQQAYAYTDDRCTHAIAHLYHQAALSLLPQSYALDGDGGCALQPPVELYEVTEVAPTALVRVDVTGTTVRSYVSEDGLALPFALRDPALDVECGPVEGAAGYACLPLEHLDDTYGLDAACATRTVAAPARCPAPAFAGYIGADCRRHVARATSTPSAIGGWQLPSCGDAENGPDAAWYLVGADVDGPTLARTVDPLLPGRRYATITVGAGLRDTVLFDSVLGVECAPLRTGDGVLRCVPVHRATVAQLSGDGTDCLSAVGAYAFVALGCAEPSPDVALRSAATPMCAPPRFDALAAGAATTAYGIIGGGCTALPVFEVGAPIDAALFGAFTTGTDP